MHMNDELLDDALWFQATDLEVKDHMILLISSVLLSFNFLTE
jgi:hypothetical protein